MHLVSDTQFVPICPLFVHVYEVYIFSVMFVAVNESSNNLPSVSPMLASYLALVSTTPGNKSGSYRKPTENMSPASA